MTRAVAIAAALLVALVLAVLALRYVGGLSGDLAQARADADAAIAANLQWQADAALARVDLLACQADWRDTQARSADAIAAAVAGRAQAAADLARWQRQWNARTPTCAESLAAMEAACAASIGDY